jgi:exopolyphosphatase/guanosine-5'-triphosphate,3'-diphosphate pyrophosphatase
MRLAILDLGTNTFSLLIVDINQNTYKEVHHAREVVKLGQESITNNIISPPAFQRGIKALCSLSKIIKQHGVDMVKALATSAIREAENSADFIAEVKRQADINVEIISGAKEAELIYYGNRLAFPMSEEPYLIMDIGGGSNEFIIASNSTILWKQSFKLGVARLLSMFNPEDPITKKTIQTVNQYLQKELQPLLTEIKKYDIHTLLGSSGAFESIVDMIGKEKTNSAKSGYHIELEDYFTISKKTIHSTSREREIMPGLIPMRRDMIVLSYILIDFILNSSDIKKLGVSAYSLKEGVITLFFKNH